MLRQCGVRYLGFPLRLPIHREDLTEDKAAAIIKSLAPPVFGVLITYLSEAREIAAFSHALGARIVQVHGDIDSDELKRLKTLDPNLTVIKSLVIGMRDDKALEATLSELSPFVDAFITDTFDPKTAASGATGKTHDWRVSRRLVEPADRPSKLATWAGRNRSSCSRNSSSPKFRIRSGHSQPRGAQMKEFLPRL